MNWQLFHPLAWDYQECQASGGWRDSTYGTLVMEEEGQVVDGSLRDGSIQLQTLLSSLTAPHTTTGSLRRFDDSQLNSVPEDPLLGLDYEPLEAQQYMPPLGTPEQQNRNPIEALPHQQKRRCASFPFYNQFVWQCNGYDHKSCLREWRFPNTNKGQTQGGKKTCTHP